MKTEQLVSSPGICCYRNYYVLQNHVLVDIWPKQKSTEAGEFGSRLIMTCLKVTTCLDVYHHILHALVELSSYISSEYSLI